jgi:hypothetical protein
MAGVIRTLSDETANRIETAVLELVPRISNEPVIEAALAWGALDACGGSEDELQVLRKRILDERGEDGGWDACGLYGDQAPHLKRLTKWGKPRPTLQWYGSRELTTAFCIQALTYGS